MRLRPLTFDGAVADILNGKPKQMANLSLKQGRRLKWNQGLNRVEA